MRGSLGPHHRRRDYREPATGAAAVIELGSWPVLPIFEHLQQLGNVPQEEMLRTFNMGLGMLLVVPSAKFKKAQSVLERVGEKYYTVGRVVKGERKDTASPKRGAGGGLQYDVTNQLRLLAGIR